LCKEEMKNCVWLKPELIAQIGVHRMDAGWSPERFKVCLLREDKDAREVEREVEG